MSQPPIMAMRNKKIVTASQVAGCFHCLEIFKPEEITEYTDQGETVLCPKCRTDTVISDLMGFDITKDKLKKIKDFWL